MTLTGSGTTASGAVISFILQVPVGPDSIVAAVGADSSVLSFMLAQQSLQMAVTVTVTPGSAPMNINVLSVSAGTCLYGRISGSNGTPNRKLLPERNQHQTFTKLG